MSSKPAKRKRPRFKRTVTADSLTAAVETVVLDALINASGMRGEHFDIHHHEGKWSAIAKHDGTHIAEVVAQASLGLNAGEPPVMAHQFLTALIGSGAGHLSESFQLALIKPGSNG